MTIALLKSYLKYRYKALAIWLAIVIFISWSDHLDLLSDLILPCMVILREIYHFKEKLENLKKLKAKGLTEKDLLNIEFVKKWDDTRTGGIWKYCIMYGLIIGGFGFSLALSLLYGMFRVSTFKQIIADPELMFRFIGINYIAGALVGVIVFRIFWFFNERRFIRLTDPLNNDFFFKKDFL